MGLGVAGAGIATSLGFIANFIVGIIFYMRGKNDIRFTKPEGPYVKTLFESFHYSVSQVTNSLTMSLTSFVVNRTILYYLGSDGIAARAIVNDLRMILNSAFIGYASTVGPIIAYNYGAGMVLWLHGHDDHGSAAETASDFAVHESGNLYAGFLRSDIFRTDSRTVRSDIYSRMHHDQPYVCGCQSSESSHDPVSIKKLCFPYVNYAAAS